jgi:hypothetical protein
VAATTPSKAMLLVSQGDASELDANVLDTLARATARFDALGKQLLDA